MPRRRTQPSHGLSRTSGLAMCYSCQIVSWLGRDIEDPFTAIQRAVSKEQMRTLTLEHFAMLHMGVI